ncbi:hypothetical protein MDA_GLEAN10025488 [Myotis davidii]|uniref:Uncharacterized protein n=1 Tax=Myotis davidii TaxID=225400 RepID=L5LMR3_MYODS|nr:hypothetical protein MDA_GLEAN10025488 [Myotis davidii]
MPCPQAAHVGPQKHRQKSHKNSHWDPHGAAGIPTEAAQSSLQPHPHSPAYHRFKEAPHLPPPIAARRHPASLAQPQEPQRQACEAAGPTPTVHASIL